MFVNEFHMTLSFAEIALRLTVGLLSLKGKNHVEGEVGSLFQSIFLENWRNHEKAVRTFDFGVEI